MQGAAAVLAAEKRPAPAGPPKARLVLVCAAVILAFVGGVLAGHVGRHSPRRATASERNACQAFALLVQARHTAAVGQQQAGVNDVPPHAAPTAEQLRALDDAIARFGETINRLVDADRDEQTLVANGRGIWVAFGQERFQPPGEVPTNLVVENELRFAHECGRLGLTLSGVG